MKKIIFLILCLLPAVAFGMDKADKVLVIKSKSKLYLKKRGKILKQYHVTFGANPRGHKQKKGDQRTPEGKYVLDYKEIQLILK